MDIIITDPLGNESFTIKLSKDVNEIKKSIASHYANKIVDEFTAILDRSKDQLNPTLDEALIIYINSINFIAKSYNADNIELYYNYNILTQSHLDRLTLNDFKRNNYIKFIKMNY